jgi:uncharacterized protein YndB with AHSA1/START domain
MYSFTLSTEIGAPLARVWRALCDPAEVVCWDNGVIAAMNPPPDYPRAGQTVRWQYRSERWPTLVDRPQEVVTEQKLRSILELGPYRMDETYTLTAADGGTRLEMALALTVQRPLVGALLERLWMGRGVKKEFEASLAALKRHCETPS